MNHRDDWPDGIRKGDLDAVSERDPAKRRSADRIAQDARNTNAVLSAMAERVGEGVPAPIRRPAVSAQRRPSRRWRAVVPLAAAAAVAALILARSGETGEEGGPLIPPPSARTPSMVSEIDVEADGPFAVFPTSDPNIAVVWLLDPRESE